MYNSNKFALVILALNIWVDSVILDKGFVKQGIGTIKGSLIMNRPFSILTPGHDTCGSMQVHKF